MSSRGESSPQSSRASSPSHSGSREDIPAANSDDGRRGGAASVAEDESIVSNDQPIGTIGDADVHSDRAGRNSPQGGIDEEAALCQLRASSPVTSYGAAPATPARTHSSVSSVSPIVDSADDEAEDAKRVAVNFKSAVASTSSHQSVKGGATPTRGAALASTKKKHSSSNAPAAVVGGASPLVAFGTRRPAPKRVSLASSPTRRAMLPSPPRKAPSVVGPPSPAARFPTKIVTAVTLANRTRASRRYREAINDRVASTILTSNQLRVRLSNLERVEGRARNELIVKKEKQELIAVLRWVDISMAYVTQVRNGLLDRRMVRGPAPLVIQLDDEDDEAVRKLRGLAPAAHALNRQQASIEGEAPAGDGTMTYQRTGFRRLHQQMVAASTAARRAKEDGPEIKNSVRNSWGRGQGRSPSLPAHRRSKSPKSPSKITPSPTAVPKRPSALQPKQDPLPKQDPPAVSPSKRKQQPAAGTTMQRKSSVVARELAQQQQSVTGAEFMARNRIETDEKSAITSIIGACFPDFILDVDFVDYTRFFQHRRVWAEALRQHRREAQQEGTPLYPFPQLPLPVYAGLVRFEGLDLSSTDAIDRAVTMVEMAGGVAVAPQETVAERLAMLHAYVVHRYRERTTAIANKAEPPSSSSDDEGGVFATRQDSVASNGDGSPKARRRRNSKQAGSPNGKRSSIVHADRVMHGKTSRPPLPARRFRGDLPTEEPDMPLVPQQRRGSLLSSTSRSHSRRPSLGDSSSAASGASTPARMRRISSGVAEGDGAEEVVPKALSTSGGGGDAPTASTVAEAASAALLHVVEGELEEEGSPLPRRPRRTPLNDAHKGSEEGNSPPRVKSTTVSPTRHSPAKKGVVLTRKAPPLLVRKVPSPTTTAPPPPQPPQKKAAGPNRAAATTAVPKPSPTKKPFAAPPRKAAVSPTKQLNVSEPSRVPAAPPVVPARIETPTAAEEASAHRRESAASAAMRRASNTSLKQTPSRRDSVKSSLLPTTPTKSVVSSRVSSRSSSRVSSRPRSASSSSSRRTRSLSSSRRSRSSSRAASNSPVPSSRAASSRSSSQPTTAPSRLNPVAAHPPHSDNRNSWSRDRSVDGSEEARRRRLGDREVITNLAGSGSREPSRHVPYDEDLVIETTVFGGGAAGDGSVMVEEEVYQPQQKRSGSMVAPNPKKKNSLGADHPAAGFSRFVGRGGEGGAHTPSPPTSREGRPPGTFPRRNAPLVAAPQARM